MTNQEMKDWIDNASYRDLLYKWRFEEAGSPWFQGKIGEYYTKTITERRNKDNTLHVATSKAIGWGD